MVTLYDSTLHNSEIKTLGLLRDIEIAVLKAMKRKGLSTIEGQYKKLTQQ